MTVPDPIPPDDVPTLPGLEHLGRRLGASTGLERVAERYVSRLIEAGRLGPGDELLAALVLDLARTVGMGAATGKAAGVAMASRQLLDAMALLPPLVPDAGGDDWQAVVAALTGGPVVDA